MRILITGARAPVALDLARALGGAGHEVVAADTMRATLAGASRYVARRLVLPPPRHQPHAFAAALLRAVERQRIDLLVPTCEEVFYVAWLHEALASRARVFCEPLGALREWHSKAALGQRAAALGLHTPRTVVVGDDAALRAALPAFPSFLLKPAFSRFATHIITNRGPRAGRLPLGACRPTPQQPWLLQEYVEGEALCSYSLLHGGHVTAHCAYATPYTAGGGAGTAFASVEGGPTLEVVRTLASGGFTGQLSLDFIRDAAGRLVLLECNPRATSGLHLLPPALLAGALLDPRHPTWVQPAGARRELALAALPAALRREGPRALRGALARDVIFRRDDPLPALAQVAPLLRFGAVSLRKRIGLLEATTDDIEWNGEDLPALDG
jgi:hypothetical protein